MPVEQVPEAAGSVARPTGGLAGRMGRHPGMLVAAIAVLAGAWAAVGSHQVFPFLTDDHDEGIYLLQADALAHGHLFPPAPPPADAFLPWLSVVSHGRFVLKYTPVHAAILAAGLWLAGSARWALALVAGGVVVLTYALAREILADRRQAALASAFLALSPLFVLQSATFLSYSSSLLLLEAFAVALLVGMRSKRRLLLVASGFLLGLAVFARPFDAVLFSVPFLLYFALSQWRAPGRLLRNAGWLAAGAAVPLIGMLAYFRAATGSPFRSPFNFLEPADVIGFGTRRLVPGQPGLRFTAAEGSYGVSHHLLLTSFWGFGGLVLVGLFLAGLWWRVTGPQLWLALVAFVFSTGYVFFWGSYGTSLRGSLSSFLGPFYFLPVLVPVTILAAKGFAQLWRHDSVIACFALAGMLIVSGYVLVKAVGVNLRLTQDDRRLYTAITETHLPRSVVFLPPIYGPQLLHPFAALRNPPDYDGKTIYALDRGDSRNLALLGDFPGRAAYRLTVEGRLRANPPDPHLTSSLERLTVVEGRSLLLTMAGENPTVDPEVVLTVTRAGRTDSLVLDRQSSTGKPYRATVSVGPTSVEPTAPVAARSTEEASPDDSLTVDVIVQSADGASRRTIYERRLGYLVGGEVQRTLLPGDVVRNDVSPDDPLVEVRAAG